MPTSNRLRGGKKGLGMNEAAEGLVCGQCNREHPVATMGPCECGGTLLVNYRFDDLSPSNLMPAGNMWRYLPLLPPDLHHVVTLGEGRTPLREMRSGLPDGSGVRTYLKDEGLSPTGTFKARGMAVAVSMATELGFSKLVVPSAGNAGVALAGYTSASGLQALVVAPYDTPPVLLREITARGARCILVKGTISEAAMCAEEAVSAGYTNLATLREPYRVEGKKTMGFELWEQLGGVPEWVVFPTGGGTGVVGIWKAFMELGELGWTDGTIPRICAVQSDGCQPLARSWQERTEELHPVAKAETVAVGLRVPKPAGFRLIMRAITHSNGVVLAVPEDAIVDAAGRMARREGIYPCYEGAAAYLGLETLLMEGWLERGDRAVLFNTGTGLINPHTPAPKLPVVSRPKDIHSLIET